LVESRPGIRITSGAGPAAVDNWGPRLTGLDSTKEEFYAWESVFLARGMATLSVDGPGQGETGFAMNIRFDYEVAVAAMLDEVAGRAELDHVCNNIPFKYRPMVADWLRDRLG
jgi:hypothetical protein